MTTGEKAHQLPDSGLESVLKFTASRGDDSFARWLDSRPVEDEEISADEMASINEAHAELAAGKPTVSHEDMKRELARVDPRPTRPGQGGHQRSQNPNDPQRTRGRKPGLPSC